MTSRTEEGQVKRLVLQPSELEVALDVGAVGVAVTEVAVVVVGPAGWATPRGSGPRVHVADEDVAGHFADGGEEGQVGGLVLRLHVGQFGVALDVRTASSAAKRTIQRGRA